MRALAQNCLHQAGEPVARTNLDEAGNASGVHRLDLGHEFDRFGELGR